MVILKSGNRREIVIEAVAGGRKMQIGQREKRQESRQVPKSVTGKEDMKGRIYSWSEKEQNVPASNVKGKDMEIDKNTD